MVACQPSDATEIVAAEHNELGITQVEIEHDVVNGERLLTVRGIDDSGDSVATATLRTGMVLYGADMPEAWNAGTELTIDAGATSATFVTPDRSPHTEVEPQEAALASFVRLTAVSTAIAGEAGIRFTQRNRDGEVSFAATSCSGANFPIANGNPSSCCQDGTDLWHKIPSGANINKLAWRTTGTACRTSAGATGCTGAGCAWGPCGARINTVVGTNTTAAAVFTPTSAPTQCGRDGNGSSAAGAYELPEAFTGAQSLKAAVTASCNYTQCLPSGSVANRVSATITGGQGFGYISTSGTTAGYPQDIMTYPMSSGFADYAPGTTVTVYASRTSGAGTIYLSGACNSTVSSGSATCQFVVNGDATLHASF